MKKQKAITPVVAIVLLLMITVGSLILLYGWIRGFQSSTQEGVEKSQHRIERNVATQIEIVSICKDKTTDNILYITLKLYGDVVDEDTLLNATFTIDGVEISCSPKVAIVGVPVGGFSPYTVVWRMDHGVRDYINRDNTVTYRCDYPFTNLIDGHTHTIKVRIGDITASVVCGPLDNGDTACNI